eukprot:CAMPEP_0184696890 /NCGR_PEP_ID=MMETSP0313-20130426/4050_1 /TAXON_ID=2792 /ORGANISM="Porphyridium aerugineum, Strain SAG 1380-2" /LENGTH=314 /DNA_ID=CAMNT_0027155611 /DNA_START=76 /DNA_END=1016 /DNA_ORIENTATION=-
MPPRSGHGNPPELRNSPTFACIQRIRAEYNRENKTKTENKTDPDPDPELIDEEYGELTAILMSLLETEAAPTLNANQSIIIIDSDDEDDVIAKIRSDIRELDQYTSQHGSFARNRFVLWINELERMPKLATTFLSKQIIDSAKMQQNAEDDDDVQIISVSSRKRPTNANANADDSDRHDVVSGSISKKQKAQGTHENAFVPLLPSFYLNRGHSLPLNQETSQTTLSLRDIVLPGCERAVLTNYNFHMEWLLATCENLKVVPRILCITGDDPDTSYENEAVLDRFRLRSQIAIVRAALPFQFGTHHSKIMILFYP